MSKFIRKAKNAFKRGGKSLTLVIGLVITAITLISTVLITTILLVVFSTTSRNTMQVSTRQIIQQGSTNLSVYLQNIVDVYDQVAKDLESHERIKELEISEDIDRETIQQVIQDTAQEVITNIQASRSDLVSITVFGNDGSVLSYAPSSSGYTAKEGYNLYDQLWYQDAKSVEGKSYRVTYPHVQNIFQNRYKWVVTVVQSIVVKNTWMLIAVDVGFQAMEEYCNEINIGNRGYVFITDTHNNIIYHPQQQLIYSGLKTESLDFLEGKSDGAYTNSETQSVVAITTLPEAGWKLVGVSFLDDVYQVMNRMAFTVVVIFLVLIILILLVSFFISRRITRPIVLLADIMEEVEAGAMDVYLEDASYYEAQRLSRSFNSMIDRIKGLMEHIKKEEKELRKTELRALQAQINPHFLYNTLDSILWMCERKNNEGAVVMVSALAKLFRISLSKGKEIITLKEELIHAESYLTIQKIRYKEQFEYSIEADESLMDCQCLKIIIQPVLENAIYHGIDRMVDKGMISIKVEEVNDQILIRVIDNGLGIPPERVKEILEDTYKGSSSGIGLKNVHNRIQIYFGKEYGLTIRSELDEGTEIDILLPKIKEGEK